MLSITKFMSLVDNQHSLSQPTVLAPPNLLATLRPFQSAAVRWMISRELAAISCCPNPSAPNPDPWLLRGGIFADEMGLGKTVSLIALLLATKTRPPTRPASIPAEQIARLKAFWVNRRRSRADQSRSAEVEPLQPIPSSTTLILCTPALITQWRHELSLHVASDHPLTVFVYEGAASKATAAQLAGSDVVLMSYTKLSAEFHFMQAARSPLLGVLFRRLVLDETQQIETETKPSQRYARARVAYRPLVFWSFACPSDERESHSLSCPPPQLFGRLLARFAFPSGSLARPRNSPVRLPRPPANLAPSAQIPGSVPHLI
jgi:SNF2 family DNA or RNA helicase